MKTIGLYWGYLIGEEHLTEEQFAQIDFGNPSIDTEFITFDPLASSYFQGKYYIMFERKLYFPHRTLPSMRSENMIIYEDTNIRIIDPPVDLNTPVGLFLCLFVGKRDHIKRAIDYLSGKINIRFSPCDLDLQGFYKKLSKTRLEISPISITISDLKLDESLKGNLKVFVKNPEMFSKNLTTYKPKTQQIEFQIKEVNFQVKIEANVDGKIDLDKDIANLNLLETIFDAATRSVYTGG